VPGAGTGGGVLPTVNVAVAGSPPRTSFESTALVVLTRFPKALPRTSTVKEQEAPLANVAPLSDIDWDPATAVIVPGGHEPDTFGGALTTMPLGSGSEKLIPVRAKEPLGFVTVKDNVLA